MTTFSTPTTAKPTDGIPADVPRDRWRRPLIVPADGGGPVPYQRPSSWGKKLEDGFGLERWKIRQTVRGLAQRNDLVTSALSDLSNDRHLDRVAQDARDAAAADAAANYGSAVHLLAEQVDRGEDIPAGLDDATRRTLAAYRRALDGIEIVASEQFVVQDQIPAAGTLDRLLRLPDGTVVVADLKTGNTDKRTGKLAYAHGVAVQMAIYARSVFYDVTTERRTDTPNIYPDAGIVIHLPRGEGVAQLHWIDLAAGWQAALLAGQVHEWRRTSGLTVPYGVRHHG